MRWGSFDPFLLGDAFWQDKMGMPVANKEFLKALLTYGSFDSYHFFCEDTHRQRQLDRNLDQLLAPEMRKRVKTSPQACFLQEFAAAPIDVMHHGDFTFFMPFLMELRRRLSLTPAFPVSGVTHSLDTVSMHNRFLQVLLARPEPFDTIVCTSACAIKMLTEAFGHLHETFRASFGAELPPPPELVRIPLGLPDEAYRRRDRHQCRSELGLPSHHLVMLSLARFSPRRKMDLAPLLECLQWLKSRRDQAFPPFTLILAGAGRPPDLSLMQAMINRLGLQQEVRIESNVNPDRKWALYGAADFFLSLVDNYQETFGLTIIEAMAQGLPVVATDFDGYKDLVSNGLTGFLIPTCASLSNEPWEPLSGLLDSSLMRFYRAQKVAFDLTELARAVTALAVQPELRQALGTRARSRAVSYRWAEIIPLYEKLWRNKAGAASQRPSGSGAQAKGPPLLVPSTQRLFSHYPSRTLDDKAQIGLSDYGRQRCRESFEPILYEELTLFFDPSCSDLLLQQLSQRDCSYGELVDQTARVLGLSRERVLLHLDWLIKHGYVQIF